VWIGVVFIEKVRFWTKKWCFLSILGSIGEFTRVFAGFRLEMEVFYQFVRQKWGNGGFRLEMEVWIGFGGPIIGVFDKTHVNFNSTSPDENRG